MRVKIKRICKFRAKLQIRSIVENIKFSSLVAKNFNIFDDKNQLNICSFDSAHKVQEEK